MARPPKLKVFRMPIGFHDAYVAAPSQKAAAAAWGTDTSVFSRKEAEEVTDPKLMAEPLANPGKVIKRLRGTADEQIAALGEDEPNASEARAKGETKPKESRPSKPKPRPSRAELEEAERALSEAEARYRQQAKEIAEREAALARERAALEKAQREERKRLEAEREKAAAAYEGAMRRWRG